MMDHATTHYLLLLLGCGFIVIALLAYVLYKRTALSQSLVRQHQTDLEKLADLNERIVQRLQYGIIVVDKADNVRLLNDAARQLLETKLIKVSGNITNLSFDLAEALRQWRARSRFDKRPYRCVLPGDKVGIEFRPLDNTQDADILIFLEDRLQISQRAQQMKLASLGRFTASIAHELRNPLGAISHAAQLLAESSSLAKDDQRFTEIIQTQTERMNLVIRNILQLSRRKQSMSTEINLKPWLDDFVAEFKRNSTETLELNVEVKPGQIKIASDIDQLRQVLTNLCENGLRYSLQKTGQAKVSIISGLHPSTQQPYIDVVDEGPGIQQKDIDAIFEPFFTTERSGTGLGLYISKELCEANQARLEYIPGVQQGACFRINFTGGSA